MKKLVYRFMVVFVLLCLFGCKTHESSVSQSVTDSVTRSFDSTHWRKVICDTTYQRINVRDSSIDIVKVRKFVEDAQRVKIDTANTRRKAEETVIKDKSRSSDQLNDIISLIHLLIKIIILWAIGAVVMMALYKFRGKNRI